jgi:hypothetical protein
MAFRGLSVETEGSEMKAGNDSGPLAGGILYLLVGPIIWAAHLLLVYGPQSALCAFRADGMITVAPFVITALVGVLTVISMAALALILWRPRQVARLLRFNAAAEADRRFAISVTRLLTALSFAGVTWAGAVALFLDPCAQLR